MADINMLKLSATVALSKLNGEIHSHCDDDAQFIEILEIMQTLITKHIEVLKEGKTPLQSIMESRMKKS